MSVDVSPDGRTIVFDLLGDLYLMPVEGGAAMPLTTGTDWDSGPRFSPDGAYVYFISDRIGQKNLWRVSLTDQSFQQVTRLNREILGLAGWSSDGSGLFVGVAAVDYYPSGEILLYSIDPSSGAMVPVEPWPGSSVMMHGGSIQITRSRKKVFSGTGGGSGDDSVFFADRASIEEATKEGFRRVRLYKFDRKTKTRTQLTAEDAPYSEFKPELSHDGKLLAYYRQYDDRRTELRVLDRASNQDRFIVRLDDADDAIFSQSNDQRPNYAFTPDDRSLVFWHGGKLRRVDLADGVSEIIPFRVLVEREVAPRAQPARQTIRTVEEARTIRWPSLSRDGQTLVFAAVGYVWVKDVASGDIRRLTTSDEFAFMPAVSPDGLSVAYIGYASNRVAPSWQDYDPTLHKPLGRLIVVDIDGQASREILSESDASFVLPEWSDDGTKISVLRQATEVNTLKRTVGWTYVSAGNFNAVVTLPTRNTRISGLHHYARWVGFDLSGERLLFSYPVSEDTTMLAMADLAGEGLRTLAIGASDVGGITPSPDLTRLALTRRDGTLWLAPFALQPEPKAVSTLTPEAYQLSENGGVFVDWYGEQRLSYGFGKDVFNYDLHTHDRQSRRISLPIARPIPDSPVAFQGARLVTLSDDKGQRRIIDNGVLLVDQGRITAVGPSGDVEMPPETVVLDIAGKTIVPGFIDTHYHAGMGSHQAPSQYYNETTAIQYGVTTAWNAGGGVLRDRTAAYADLHTAGRVIGPRWSYSAAAAGEPYDLLDSETAALANIDRSKSLGTTIVKEYEVHTRAQQRRLADAARHHQLGIVSHLDGFEMTMSRVVDGYTGGDHFHLPMPFYEDVYQLLVQTGYIWTPNLLTAWGSMSPSSAVPSYFCRALNDGRTRSDLGKVKVPSTCEISNENAWRVVFDTHRAGRIVRQTMAAARRGVAIGVSAHNAPGSNLHIEMWALSKGGMPIEDVLRATSRVNAEKLGLEAEIGSLEAGKVADFVVLDGNPLDNILNTMSIEYTIQGGVIFDADDAERITPEDLQAQLITEAAINDDSALQVHTGTDD